MINLIDPFGRHFCRPYDRRHIVAQMAGEEMSLTHNRDYPSNLLKTELLSIKMALELKNILLFNKMVNGLLDFPVSIIFMSRVPPSWEEMR